jgi:alpha-beta hydrolase superfamily lysophospholipase
MKQFYLAEIVTKDKLVHQGLFFRPKKSGKKAILWIHGLTSTFYNNVTLFESIVEVCEKNGMGFAAFNNRGHDIVTGMRKIDEHEPKGYRKVTGGAGNERFEDCVYDIEAGISFLADRGFADIILAGHSSVANKACYYGGVKKDKRVCGIALISPVSDRLDPGLDKEKTARRIAEMKKEIAHGRGDELLAGIHMFPVTPRRMVSLYGPRSAEDTFDYGDPNPTLSSFRAIRVSTLILMGSLDEYLDRPVEQMLDVFASRSGAKNFQYVIIRGALHGFNGKEREMAGALIRWAKEL